MTTVKTYTQPREYDRISRPSFKICKPDGCQHRTPGCDTRIGAICQNAGMEDGGVSHDAS